MERDERTKMRRRENEEERKEPEGGGVSRGQEDGIGDTRIIKEGREFSLKERRR